jgi:hypothetical protein
MSDYTWEMGIDWNAIKRADGSSYMRQGLVREGEVVMPSFQSGDTITFVIFDVSSNETSAQVTGIESFAIFSQAAVGDQPVDNLLSCLQPTFTLDLTTASTLVFGHAFRSWSTPQAVIVDPQSVNPPSGIDRFLLNFQAQAQGLAAGSSRIFGHDPEMVVGPNM